MQEGKRRSSPVRLTESAGGGNALLSGVSWRRNVSKIRNEAEDLVLRVETSLGKDI